MPARSSGVFAMRFDGSGDRSRGVAEGQCCRGRQNTALLWGLVRSPPLRPARRARGPLVFSLKTKSCLVLVGQSGCAMEPGFLQFGGIDEL